MAKRKADETDTVVMSLRIDKALMQALKKLAEREDKPFPYFMRRLLHDAAMRGNR